MLKKLSDGKEVLLSDTEERQQRGFWALNEKYPEYVGHCGWDGVNEPFHNIVECRKHHKSLVQKAHDLAKADLTKQIEMAQEDGLSSTEKLLFAQRKALRAHLDKDFSSCKTVDELRFSIPEDLKPYWNK